MNQSVCILGRQSALGLAELESLLGAAVVHPIGINAAVLDVDPADIPFNRLGGSIKLAKLLARLETTDWNKIEAYLIKTIPDHLRYIPEGKFKLGLSVYGFNISPGKINASGLNIKKAIKAAGRSVRIIPNKQQELNAAQILHNQLTAPNGWELVIIRDGNSALLAQTTHVQDIDAYAARDQARPKRDARVGMLPPKLAQIIINLATGELADGRWKMEGSKNPTTILDPFCGTGVILQEAALMGYRVSGSDLEGRMIQYSRDNLNWLAESHHIRFEWFLEPGDATNHRWPTVDLIACETYLGRPFTGIPTPKVLQEVMQDCDTIHRKFLKNVTRQTSAGFRLCIAVPAWKTREGFKHLKTLESLEELGYTRLSFKHASTRELLYFRPDQIVARELVVLVRK
jgi:tRNA G10  N-methylase Trm11